MGNARIESYFSYSDEQIGTIVSKVVKLVASEEDQLFFTKALYEVAYRSESAAEFNVFIEKLLKSCFGGCRNG